MAAAPAKQNKLVRWIDNRLPIFTFMSHELNDYPTPRNLSYWWNFGSPPRVMLGIMILSCVFLAMAHTPHKDMAFQSVERLLRDLNLGVVLPHISMNGPSRFFIL